MVVIIAEMDTGRTIYRIDEYILENQRQIRAFTVITLRNLHKPKSRNFCHSLL